jgi:hypothetical protein
LASCSVNGKTTIPEKGLADDLLMLVIHIFTVELTKKKVAKKKLL